MIGRAFLRSGVARGLFALFVLCALVPLAVLAALSLTQVRSLLLSQGEQRLAAQAKSYGMSVFERLLLATDVAYAAGSSPAAAVARDSMAPRVFRSLALVSGEKVTPLIGTAVQRPWSALVQIAVIAEATITVPMAMTRRVGIIRTVPALPWRRSRRSIR